MARNLELPTGRYEDALSWIGRTHEEPCEEVSWAISKMYCSLVRDPDPAYWEGVLAPPGTLMVWSMPLPWSPAYGAMRGPVPLFAAMVPLPGDTLINVMTETSFSRSLRIGDRMIVRDEIVSISPSKRTRLGEGHFVNARSEYRDARTGAHVATHTNVMLRYRAMEAPAPAAAAPAPIPPGAETFEVTLASCVLNAGATRDLFPGHHDRDYAKAQGARDVYLNTMFFHGFVDRVARATIAGPASLEQRTLEMLAPACVGDVIVATTTVGTVVEGTVDVAVTGSVDGIAVVTAELRFRQGQT